MTKLYIYLLGFIAIPFFIAQEVSSGRWNASQVNVVKAYRLLRMKQQ
jgi:hypothetical protein